MRRLATAWLRVVPTLVSHRFLLGQLAWRAFASRHAGSYLGWLWTPLSTIVQFLLFLVVFSAILKMKAEGLGIDLARRPDVGFGLFLITGLAPYLALGDAVQRAAGVFRSHASLVQRVRLPAEVLVLGDVFGALLHHCLSLVVVVAICAARGSMRLADLPWAILAALLFVVWIVGLGLVVSVLGAALPDISEALGLSLQVLFYGAPIVYPLAWVPEGAVRFLVELNPVTPLVGVARTALLGAAPPSMAAIGFVVGGGVLLVVVGAAALDRWRTAIPDLL